jgi:curved DNA-binding protein CbpA
VTLYEVLGVNASASGEDLHRAYRDRARVLHPDHRGGADDAAMQELNAAWAVLSDPVRRREYDRSLAPTAVAPLPPVAAARPEGDEAFYGGDGVATLARALPLIVVLVVLAAIFVFTAFAIRGPDDPSFPTSGADPEVGSCVTVRAGHIDEIVACGGPNDGRVQHVIDRSQPCPSGERRADSQDGSHALCLV